MSVPDQNGAIKITKPQKVGNFSIETTGMSYEEAKRSAGKISEAIKEQDIQTIQMVAQHQLDMADQAREIKYFEERNHSTKNRVRKF
jgi:Mn-dependent DtxR family transcriptional regulator